MANLRFRGTATDLILCYMEVRVNLWHLQDAWATCMWWYLWCLQWFWRGVVTWGKRFLFCSVCFNKTCLLWCMVSTEVVDKTAHALQPCELNVYIHGRVGSSHLNVAMLYQVLAPSMSASKTGHHTQWGTLLLLDAMPRRGELPSGGSLGVVEGISLTGLEREILAEVCPFCLLCGIQTGAITTRHAMPAKLARIFLHRISSFFSLQVLRSVEFTTGLPGE